MSRNGFTLVEMLVALAIFGLIAAAGVGLLSVSLSAQQAAETKLAQVAALRRASALLAADLSNATPRLRRDEAGTTRPAFETGADGFDFVRRGWENPDGEPRASLQRVSYRLANGVLERRSSAHVDGAPAERGSALLRGVRRLSLRFRAADGHWRERWDPLSPQELPRALDLVIETERYGTVRQLFLVGAAG